MNTEQLSFRPDVVEALQQGRAVVALESTLIAHGLPWPINLETALAAEQAVSEAGAVPATIAILAGRVHVGLSEDELRLLARAKDIRKASSRDLGIALALKQNAATTVAATMRLAHQVGIRVFATGGIGGVHPGSHFDISADLMELGRTPVAVVCAGAKSILDLPATMEVLETLAVPVLGYQSDRFAAFYLRQSECLLNTRVESAQEVARCLQAHWSLGGAGVVISLPLSQDKAIAPEALTRWLHQAEQEAHGQGIAGPALTPFLLARLAELSGGQTLKANQELIVANARLAGAIAMAWNMRQL